MLRQASTLLTFVILNEVKDLAHCPTRFFATEAQNDRQRAGSREQGAVRFCHSERSEESELLPTRSFAVLRMTGRSCDLVGNRPACSYYMTG